MRCQPHMQTRNLLLSACASSGAMLLGQLNELAVLSAAHLHEIAVILSSLSMLVTAFAAVRAKRERQQQKRPTRGPKGGDK